jgi:hypothetical protein
MRHHRHEIWKKLFEKSLAVITLFQETHQPVLDVWRRLFNGNLAMGSEIFDSPALEKANIKLTAPFPYSCLFLKCLNIISLNTYEFTFFLCRRDWLCSRRSVTSSTTLSTVIVPLTASLGHGHVFAFPMAMCCSFLVQITRCDNPHLADAGGRTVLGIGLRSLG